ncbi:MAG: MBL fold metallo-hydrolase [Phycisphaeraceae bacterium]
MIPRQPPRNPQMGFLYVPPYRVQGISIAGEQTVIQVPELDVCFDIGSCPKAVLPSNFVALSHGHMDHSASLAYYFSQRHFQGIGTGKVICHPAVAGAIENVMNAWVDLEHQRTPHEIIPLEPDAEIEVKNNVHLRGFATEHTVPSLGYVAVERRSKLRPEYAGLPQEKLVELKQKGEGITQTLEIPLICYTGDTMWGPHFDREDVLNAQILITECTFLETGHRGRASVGKHLHLDDIVELLDRSKAEAVILTHLSRRTHMGQVRQALDEVIPDRHQERVLVLMDRRTNRKRYEQQLAEAEAKQSEGS